MPTFDFQCKACGHVFEFSRPFGSKTIPKCPACASKKTEKLIAPPPVHFKGSGWYKTDSKVGPKQEKGEAPGKDTKATEGTEGTKENPASASKTADAKDTSPKVPPKKSEK